MRIPRSSRDSTANGKTGRRMSARHITTNPPRADGRKKWAVARKGAAAQAIKPLRRTSIAAWGLKFSRRRAFLPHGRSEEHTSELQSLMRISYAVFCLKKTTTSGVPLSFPGEHL